MTTKSRIRFSYETRRVCRQCKRELDAVRVIGESGLLVSRHLARGRDGFCDGSLDEAPR